MNSRRSSTDKLYQMMCTCTWVCVQEWVNVENATMLLLSRIKKLTLSLWLTTTLNWECFYFSKKQKTFFIFSWFAQFFFHLSKTLSDQQKEEDWGELHQRLLWVYIHLWFIIKKTWSGSRCMKFPCVYECQQKSSDVFFLLSNLWTNLGRKTCFSLPKKVIKRKKSQEQ